LNSIEYTNISNNCLKFAKKYFNKKNHLKSLLEIYNTVKNESELNN
jgi:hypothetical protein